MCASQNSEAGGENKQDEIGLVQGHAYALLDVQRFRSDGEELRLLCLRNPWGGGSWTGRWKAGDAEWMRNDSNGLSPLHYLMRHPSAHAAAAVCSAYRKLPKSAYTPSGLTPRQQVPDTPSGPTNAAVYRPCGPGTLSKRPAESTIV